MHDTTQSMSCGVGITAIGGRIPEQVVTNADLEGRLQTTDAWINENIGIQTRHWSGPEEGTSDLGAAALIDACERAGVSPDSIDLVICGTYTPDHMIPAAAVAIMRRVGMRDVPGFDVNSGGCPGGVFALDVGAKYIASGQYRRVAVVLSDVTTKLFDPEDRTVGVIFGDAAACYLLEPTRAGVGLSSALMRSDPTTYETAYVKRERRSWPDGSPKQTPFGDNFCYMHGRSVRDYALDRIPEFFEELVKNSGLTPDEVDLVIFHQANFHLIYMIMDRIGLPPEKTLTTVQRLGNTSGSGVPLALRDAQDQGRVKPGDVVVLISFGAGMSHGGTIIRWPKTEDYVRSW